MNKLFVIYTIINDKQHFVSETIKIFTGQLTPGFSKKSEDAITFESYDEATTTIANIRDLHGRKFQVEEILTESKKTYAAYKRAQKEKELN
jgi:hypothetical protein